MPNKPHNKKGLLPNEYPKGITGVSPLPKESYERLCALQAWDVDEAICAIHGVSLNWREYPYCNDKSGRKYGGNLSFDSTKRILIESIELEKLPKTLGGKISADLFLLWASNQKWKIPEQFLEKLEQAKEARNLNEVEDSLFSDSPEADVLLTRLKDLPKNHLQLLATGCLILCWKKQKNIASSNFDYNEFLASKFGKAIKDIFGQQDRITIKHFRTLFPNTPPSQKGRPKKLPSKRN